MKGITLLLLAITTLTTLYAQREASSRSKVEIEVAGHKLHLGMTKAEVTEKLTGVEITKIHDDEWMVGSLEKKELGPTLQFTKGVLSYAERFWRVSDNDTVEQLVGVVSSLNNEGFSQCSVTSDTNDSPDIRAKRVWIMCGDKSVLVIRRTIVGGHSHDGLRTAGQDEGYGVVISPARCPGSRPFFER
jgi:hypothetical protein